MAFAKNLPAVDPASLPEDAYLLDVREPEEWRAGHAPDAVHIPLGGLSDRANEVPQDRDVYVVCRSGHRSARAAMALNNAGWRAINVDGGMQAWMAAGKPMVADGDLEPFVA
jgi:rhodanese-related sulfurtransferase